MNNNDLIDLLSELIVAINILKSPATPKKRWLNSNEAADYIGYSIDGLRKLKDVNLFLDVHYFKTSGKLLFDQYALDDWVMGTNNV